MASLKLQKKPLQTFVQEGLNFQRVLKPNVKHTNNRKANDTRGKSDHNLQKRSIDACNEKSSIESLIQKSMVSLADIVGNSFGPNNFLSSDLVSRVSANEKKAKSVVKSKVKISNNGDSQGNDSPRLQKKINVTSDEHLAKLHSSISNSKKGMSFSGINVIENDDISPVKMSPFKVNDDDSVSRMTFPILQDYEIKSLCGIYRKSSSTASYSQTPSDYAKEINSELPDVPFSQLSQSTRANSFALCDIESVESDDVLVFSQITEVGAKLFEENSDDEELECEEIVGSAEKKQPDFCFFPLFDFKKQKPGLDKDRFEVIENMKSSQSYYNADPHHLAMKQPEVTENMRAILIDWMIELSVDFKLKRDTLYIAVTYLNKYLSVVPQIPMWKLQLVGVTSLLLAAKNEEIQVPRVADFAKATDDGYNADQIKEMELELCKVLQWRLNPTTPYTTANYLMSCWDKYMDLVFQNEQSHEFGIEQSEIEVTQILDLLLLDVQSLQCDITSLVVSVIYLVMGQASQKITRNEIINYNCSFGPFENKETKKFNQIFSSFLKEHISITLDDLKSSFKFVTPYFDVGFCFEAPSTIKENSKLEYKGNYEDFLSSQTHSPNNLPFVQSMLEGKP